MKDNKDFNEITKITPRYSGPNIVNPANKLRRDMLKKTLATSLKQNISRRKNIKVDKCSEYIQQEDEYE